MALSINTNVSSLSAQRNLGVSQGSLATSMQRLSSGLRINSAKDDAAGLAISSRMTAQVRGVDQAARNANDGISLAQVAEGALGTVDGALAAISGQRAQFGALQSRFETTIASLQTTSENLSASRSRIMDADFAMETANLSRTQILQQAGTAMVAQANQLPQGVLALLR
jgi:flagellin